MLVQQSNQTLCEPRRKRGVWGCRRSIAGFGLFDPQYRDHLPRLVDRVKPPPYILCTLSTGTPCFCTIFVGPTGILHSRAFVVPGGWFLYVLRIILNVSATSERNVNLIDSGYVGLCP